MISGGGCRLTPLERTHRREQVPLETLSADKETTRDKECAFHSQRCCCGSGSLQPRGAYNRLANRVMAGLFPPR